ncbi:YkvA family protein [Croceicoccus esteveae]|uniref:YkvA family protein n=1 Tax=Croceicoccus esteveae TaxID=3075597 RepID=UPI003D788795
MPWSQAKGDSGNYAGATESLGAGDQADVIALNLAIRDRRTPLLAKVIAVGVVAYALSPIDLIPDFIPVLGYLDDLVILPLGIMIAVRLIPPPLMAEYRKQESGYSQLPSSRAGIVIVIMAWTAGASMLGLFALHYSS